MKKTDYSLMFVTDERITDDREFLIVLESALKGGVSIVQLREKKLNTKPFYNRAIAVKDLCAKYNIPFIINDRIDIALAVNADGVHLGQKDLPVSAARALLGSNKIIGWSVSNEEQALEANHLEVDYIGLSPVFSTNTKTKDLNVPLGIEGLKRLKLISSKPIVCIGGVDEKNAASIMQNGADGIAVISAISQSNNSYQKTKILKKIIENTKKFYKSVLTIAGSDSGGCAGIQADIKSISACGAYAASVITATTAQNTQGIIDIHPIPVSHIEKQLDAVLSDIHFDSVKIGMLHSCEVINMVSVKLSEYRVKNIVIDPVMIATSGDKLIADDAISCLKKLLFQAFLITPNSKEAEVLIGHSIDKHNVEATAKEIGMQFKTSVLLKGRHLDNPTKDVFDVLYEYETGRIFIIKNHKINTNNTHGTGCSLSSAIAAFLSKGYDLENAVKKACEYINIAIAHGKDKILGKGNGPINHFRLE